MRKTSAKTAKSHKQLVACWTALIQGFYGGMRTIEKLAPAMRSRELLPTGSFEFCIGSLRILPDGWNTLRRASGQARILLDAIVIQRKQTDRLMQSIEA